ncbi:hypothetical protein Sros_6966 [Streptosporangium roseum DSM 43021]|uniref:Uncharacterized protein n=1 Tax=Streptosporangium roseum (strain ATCC 12428 / DSM 43021 / JCM 3005 / KCTC 9067 / NCIMB 10171 / NRRL 2505 / NI 9100) TaxID=479432 RepID=D2B8R1_STRRD|nr:hypothetical protein Sros_6966 [Streptosporangium roseum DSM 43021]
MTHAGTDPSPLAYGQANMLRRSPLGKHLACTDDRAAMP